MFAVKPIKDLKLQKEICTALGTAYIENSMAFFASDMCDDLETVKSIIGVCQFSVGKDGEILTLVPAKGREDDEAMIIMCRAVMSFIYKLGIKTMTVCENAGPRGLLEKIGIPYVDGEYIIDLEEFYKEPCRYRKN